MWSSSLVSSILDQELQSHPASLVREQPNCPEHVQDRPLHLPSLRSSLVGHRCSEGSQLTAHRSLPLLMSLKLPLTPDHHFRRPRYHSSPQPRCLSPRLHIRPSAISREVHSSSIAFYLYQILRSGHAYLPELTIGFAVFVQSSIVVVTVSVK
jgi:hypothetical protein